MNPVPLIHAQLVPQRVKKTIRRTSLLDLGMSILSHRVTTITAPAGYGKSVWVSSLLEEPGWPPTAWLSLDHHDSEPAFLLYHLIHAIRMVYPGFGTQSLRTMNSLEDVNKNWQIAICTLLEEMSLNTEFVLVLDDVHLIEYNPTSLQLLEYLIRWFPAETHLVLISRNKLPLNLHREQISGELLQIGSTLLLFSATEARELLMSLNLEPTEKEVKHICSVTEGWAVALRLLGLYLKQSNCDVAKTLRSLRSKDTDLYSYLSNELLQHIPDQLKDFLLDASLLPYLEPNLCNAAMQRSDSDAKIITLHAHGILSRSEGDTITWRLHHLMGQFLEQKALALRAPCYVTCLRHRAAAFLEQRGDIDSALEQVMACFDWPAAASILHIHGDNFFLQSGRPDALSSWIDRLPEDLVDANHRLLHFKGMSILHTQQKSALEYLSRAYQLASKNDDVRCQISSLYALICVYTFSNNVIKIKETSERIQTVATLLEDDWSKGMVLAAALSQAAWEDDLKQGEQLSWQVNKLKLDPLSRTTILAFSCMVQFRMGSLAAAVELLESLLADPFVQENDRWTGEAYTIYSVVCALSGNFEKLKEVSGKLLHLGEKYRSPHQLGFAHMGLARLFLNEGHSDKAREEFELSRDNFVQGGNIFYTLAIDLEMILLRLRAGENATDLLEETHCIMEKLHTLPGGRGLDDYILSLAGIIAMETGQIELARQRFEEVAQRSKQKGARQALAGTRLFLARLALLKGDYDTADRYLRQALGAAQAEKWEYFWDWHADTVYTLCRRAVLKEIHPKWAAHLLRRWFPQRTCGEAFGLLTCPDENVQSCISGLIKDTVRETHTPHMHVSCLGGFRIFVNGKEIPSSGWRTQKARNLAIYLLINRHSHLKEKLIEALWPEANPKQGDASLRMALTHLRQTLGLKLAGGDSVILRRGIIRLSPEIKIHTDYELFSISARRALESPCPTGQTTIELLEQAAALYTGDFLPNNIYDDWTAGLRTRLHSLYLQVLIRLAQAYRHQGRPEAAIEVCRRYLTLEPADETVTRMAMELLWQSGQKKKALSLYRELAAILAKEYTAIPSVETVRLYERIRSGG